MNFKVFEQIVQLNKEFYEKVGDDFSSTRQAPWKGWSRVVEEIKGHFKNGKLSLIDVACGNGRFQGFIDSNLTNINYVGVDSSEVLLEKAKTNYPSATFEHYDVVLELNKMSNQYDIVVAFGITHHIPSQEFRETWFENLSKLVKPGGLLIFTIWDFFNDASFDVSKTYIPSHINKAELEEGDYFLSWDRIGGDVLRYCHHYSESEINKISEILERNGMELNSTWKDDGKGGVSNLYFVYTNSK